MKKIILLVLISLFYSANVLGQEKISAQQNTKLAQIDSDRALLPEPCKDVLDNSGSVTCWTNWSNRVIVGPGISTVTIGFNGNFGLMDQITPVELSLNFYQSISAIKRGSNEVYTKYIFWRAALGFIITKDAEQDLTIGLIVTPWSIKINDFSVGIGIGYKSTSDKVTFENENLFVSIPLTYKINF